MTPEELLELLQPGHEQTLMHRLAGLSEAERKKLAPAVRKVSPWSFTGRYDDHALGIAVLGTLGGVRQVAQHLPTHGTHPEGFPAMAVQVLSDRQPAWLESLPGALLVDGATHWRLVRALVREGLVERPDEAEYFVQLGWGVLPEQGRDEEGVLGALRTDPGLLDHELWSMLGTEGAGRRLRQTDGWMAELRSYDGNQQRSTPTPERTWAHALVTLSATGEVDRGRLLDAVLAAPLRDWAAADQTWFLGLHDALDPTPDEVVARQHAYARLLTAEHGPAVKLAQRRLRGLLDDERLDRAAVLDASQATLSRSDKGTVAAQLKLLGALAEAHPGTDLGAVLVPVLGHPQADVRDQARALLTRLGVPAEAAPTVTEVFVPPTPVDPPAPAPVVPVADADELAELFLRLVEEANDPIEVERAVDGVLRLADDRPMAADVLLRRVEELQQFDLRDAMGALASAWLRPRSWSPRPGQRIMLADLGFASKPPRHGLVGVATARLNDVAGAVRRGSRPTLALPSHDDGTIDPEVLSARLAALGRRQEPPAREAALAALRVDPARLVDVVVPRRGTAARAFAGARRRLLESTPRWEGETRQITGRWSWQPPMLVTTFLDPGSGRTGASPVDGLLDRSDPWADAMAELSVGAYDPRFEQLVAFCGLMLPHRPDLLAAHLHPALVRALDKDRGGLGPLYEQLARSAVPTMAPECSALVLGLAAKDPLVRTGAVDALIDLARTGRLAGTELGHQAARLLSDGVVIGKRVSDGLAEAARADEAAVLPLLVALNGLLRSLPGRRDAGAFLELVADLADRAGRRVSLPDELRELARGRSTSRTARAARRLV